MSKSRKTENRRKEFWRSLLSSKSKSAVLSSLTSIRPTTYDHAIDEFVD